MAYEETIDLAGDIFTVTLPCYHNEELGQAIVDRSDMNNHDKDVGTTYTIENAEMEVAV